MATKSREKAEFGDFQTPEGLAREVCQVVAGRIGSAGSVLEPTCGRGAFLGAALELFGGAKEVVGYDLNPGHLATAAERLEGHGRADRLRLRQADFFDTDWEAVLRGLGQPPLVLGNPPWVTNAELGSFGGANLPPKASPRGLKGLDALTGKANFDISEWMLLRLLEALRGSGGTLAMLVKTTVARRLLRTAWTTDLPTRDAAIFAIDAKRHFAAEVDACLFVIGVGGPDLVPQCEIHDNLQSPSPSAVIGIDDGCLLADREAFERRRHLLSQTPPGWRSGVKHDCAKVFELRRAGDAYVNGFGHRVQLEPGAVFPLLKSSDVAHGRLDSDRYVVLPQRRIGDDTAALEKTAPRAWAYLRRHRARLDGRKSSIYRQAPRFAIFGIGDYSFAPWKVAISGLYKQLRFTVVPPREGSPVMLDDTVNFLPCAGEKEAAATAALLNGPDAADFFSAFLFRDAKRPVTVSLLNRLDLKKLAAEGK